MPRRWEVPAGSSFTSHPFTAPAGSWLRLEASKGMILALEPGGSAAVSAGTVDLRVPGAGPVRLVAHTPAGAAPGFLTVPVAVGPARHAADTFLGLSPSALPALAGLAGALFLTLAYRDRRGRPDPIP